MAGASTSDYAVSVRGVGKKYHLGAAAQDTLRDQVASLFRRRAAVETGEFWAVRDVSFDVPRGEVLGIIGHNGAGKSTLLKILSQITEPTEGEIRVRGRVASLLEVGTGFHPELSGRENIFLNGAILGMTRAEIRRKFAEIVAFSEVEKFLDTPVKHYSSGMYVRLAFAVAAYLEPEILVVDEVLAVGDAAFQARCLARMGELSRGGGRTVLFVSHNLQAVQALCSSALLLEKGAIKLQGDPRTVVAEYLTGGSTARCEMLWPEDEAPGTEEFKLTGVSVSGAGGAAPGVYSTRNELRIELRFNARRLWPDLCVGFDLLTASGEVVARSYQNDQAAEEWPKLEVGENFWRCRIPGGLLNAGQYVISPRIGLHNIRWLVKLDGAVQFEMILDHGVSPFWNSLRGKQNRPGAIASIFAWESAARPGPTTSSSHA